MIAAACVVYVMVGALVLAWTWPEMHRIGLTRDWQPQVFLVIAWLPLYLRLLNARARRWRGRP